MCVFFWWGGGGGKRGGGGGGWGGGGGGGSFFGSITSGESGGSFFGNITSGESGGTIPTPTEEIPQEEIILKEKEGKIEIAEYSNKIEIIKLESLEKTFGVTNIGEGDLNNVKLAISGLPLDIYTITPEKYDLIASGETKIFTITFKADIEAKEYKIKFIVASDEGNEEVNTVLVVSEKSPLMESSFASSIKVL